MSIRATTPNGASPSSEKPSAARYAYGIEAFAEAIADLIAAFGVGRVHVVGHSMGGAVAITLAAGHPELVQRLVVEDPLCYPFPMGFRRKLPLQKTCPAWANTGNRAKWRPILPRPRRIAASSIS